MTNNKIDNSRRYRLNEYIDKEDALFAIGKYVDDYSCTPQMDLLTKPRDCYLNDGYWDQSSNNDKVANKPISNCQTLGSARMLEKQTSI